LKRSEGVYGVREDMRHTTRNVYARLVIFSLDIVQSPERWLIGKIALTLTNHNGLEV